MARLLAELDVLMAQARTVLLVTHVAADADRHAAVAEALAADVQPHVAVAVQQLDVAEQLPVDAAELLVLVELSLMAAELAVAELLPADAQSPSKFGFQTL